MVKTTQWPTVAPRATTRVAFVLAMILALIAAALAVSTAILGSGGSSVAPAAAATLPTTAPPASFTASPSTVPPTPSYQLSLGDSLAAGTGASTPADSYVNLVAAHEAQTIQGLQVENLSCGGATTDSMINASDPANSSCPAYPTGTQLGAAEAFLQSHPGQTRYITIDIGGNNVDACLPGGHLSISCITHGLALIRTQLPEIISGLERAAPGVPVFGMDYYNPFLAEWVIGGPGGHALATESATLSSYLNGELTQIYGAGGATPVDVQGAFATQDFAMTGSFAGVTVPVNVARTCDWTHMCDHSGLTIHANDIGHAKLAHAFERAIDRWLAGGGTGTWLTGAAGGITALGNARSFGSLAGRPLAAPIVAMVPTRSDQGYWLVAADGGVFSFGDAGFFGSMGGVRLNAPIVGFAPTTDGRGYWLVAADGGVFSFGDAGFFGSMGGFRLNAPMVGMAQSGSNQGYWLVAADGGVFSFGDARFIGSMGGTQLNHRMVGMATTIDGNGYWLVASDGEVFSFGDALFHGSTGGIVVNKPVVGMTVAPDGFGYTLGASDGGVFAFGRASFNGSAGGHPPSSPVVAIATT